MRWVVVLTGSNDISASDMLDTPKDKVSAQQIITGLEQLIARAHAKGIKVYGATVLPKAGWGNLSFTRPKRRRSGMSKCVDSQLGCVRCSRGFRAADARSCAARAPRTGL